MVFVIKLINIFIQRNISVFRSFGYLLVFVFAGPLENAAQTYGGATQIYTDFNGYWTSAAGANNPVQPDDSHHLLGFTWQGTVYSTGVDDGRLISEGVPHSEQIYQAFPVRNIQPKSSGTYIGLAQIYDGVDGGISDPPPFGVPPNLSTFLTDGLQGLDYGTGVANIAAGNVIFDFSGIIDPTQISDGIPDILVTQFADPSSTLDEIFLTDENGNQVGNSLSINHTTIDILGQWSADFYELDGNSAAFTKSSRDLRLWVAELESFGINMGNYQGVRSLRYRLNGSSDLAFAAYKVGVFDIVAANNDEGFTNQEEPVVLNVLDNDLPAEILDPAYLSILEGPQNGTLSINLDTGAIEYTPASEFYGTDQFTYEICGDGGLQCDEALVTIEVNQVTLPVKWIDFSGRVIGNRGVALKWATANEKNSSYYDIQSSFDGKKWRVMGRVEGVGYAFTQVNYSHFVPVQGAGRIYFRLRQVDRDGQSSYSEIWAVELFELMEKKVLVYPNPAFSEIRIDGLQFCESEIRIVDLSGNDCTHLVTIEKPMPCSVRLEIASLPEGIYLAKVGNQTFKFKKF
ncbi:Ig-like domain-containing protein [Cyclobacterium jeungdonense]|uniref:Ig-like domain-containing protein n=1 Tax=Cyclobacterium jeungdonense TaxID=708087 RepID=A0ABT8C3B1_9BACT|nr:Ig-like domain-containing protein [Cyclobacterium jeungdonense]MDN3686572.1 Ig-like domain-containing protein [Cyclobacterium jeungdonense]